MTTFHSLIRRPKNSSAKSNKPFFGKVTRVIYDKTNPNEVGSIYYRNLTDPDSRERNQAYPLYAFLKNVPLVDEVILLITAPSSETDKGIHKSRIYYISTVSIWNHPHHGATTEDKDTVGLDGDFTERADVNPMLPFPGDTILEGRLGQSIRFSQSIPGKTPWIGPLGAPITVLSNGQITTANGFECITEDINKDHTSLYLTSTQKLPITPGNKLTQPLSEYDKSQAILTSGRLVLNARDSNLILSTPSALEASARTVIIKSESDITQQAERINLGAAANERGILGDTMLRELSATLTELVKLTTVLGTLGIAPLSAPATAFATRASKFILDIETMKSNKVFLEK
jgi:hypothetical protein